MSPVTLFIVIVAAVALGIAVAPYVGTVAAVIGALLLAVIALFIVYKLLHVAVAEGTSITKQIAAGIRLYFRALPRSWQMLVGSSQPGESNSLRRRMDGFIVLFVWLLWALVVVGMVLLVLFPTHARA